MEKIIKKSKVVPGVKHPLDQKFSSIEEAAKSKTEYLTKTVFKDADWNSLKK